MGRLGGQEDLPGFGDRDGAAGVGVSGMVCGGGAGGLVEQAGGFWGRKSAMALLRENLIAATRTRGLNDGGNGSNELPNLLSIILDKVCDTARGCSSPFTTIISAFH